MLFILVASFFQPSSSSSMKHLSKEAISQEDEKEIVIYARIGNPAGLSQATQKIKQLQAQIIAPRSRIRIRREQIGDSPVTYQMTTKTPVIVNGLQMTKEHHAEVTEDALKVFMNACDQYQEKTRYVFPIEKATILTKDMKAEVTIENLKFEVDVFTTPSGKQSDWCKIDVEVQSLLPQLAAKGLKLSDIDLNIKIKALPFEPFSYFVDTGEKTGPMRDLVTLIYDTQFVHKLATPTE